MEEKRIAVRYLSRTGNTKKLADAIAQAVGVEAESIPAPLAGRVDVLFLGAAVYWAGIDGRVKDYIRALDPDGIGEVVIFSDSALAERAAPGMKKLLEERGLRVSEKDFYCRGQFSGLHKGRPNAQDLADAADFAKKAL